MTTLPPRSNPAWALLPKKPCKNCGRKFKPTRPNADYCKKDCKDAYNRHGGAFVKLKLALAREIKRQMSIEQPCERCKGTNRMTPSRPNSPPCGHCKEGKILTAYGREVFDALNRRGYLPEPNF